jgi:DNA (cytosine-5)-methyltransferase 1
MKQRGAYYNEHDPKAAAWLRELIRSGWIAPGDVDERSIEDVKPDDLKPYIQCHFFAGIGVWSYALGRAGWSDDRPVWTGSCPCQPFSASGKSLGFADERHLWPAWLHLVRECRPVRIFGEQVASTNGLLWRDLVHADMEAEDYTVGWLDLCAAGFGAPHIRQRLCFVGFPRSAGLERYARHGDRGARWPDTARPIAAPGATCGLADGDGNRRNQARENFATEGNDGSIGNRAVGTLADPQGIERQPGLCAKGSIGEGRIFPADGRANGRTSPLDGFWRNADWLLCRDGKWRPVEAGTSPLAHGAPARVGRLRGYGNAIVADQAIAFIEAAEEYFLTA